ncbi:MAG: class I SAM-dependent methyltransferase [Reyranella sp.]|nr:class I SAM-dependent methyltransferase [Reyranella sp.]
MTSDDDITADYRAFYRARNPTKVYPVEFVVRAYLGNYPRLQRGSANYVGKLVLDLGFGDGRNIGLLHDLGMTVSGVETSEEICTLTRARLERQGIAADLRVGRNRAIPFGDAAFDHVLACHACYYVDPGTSFDDNVREIGRVMKPGGAFIFSAPMRDTYLLKSAVDLGDGHMQVMNDPYGVRNGCTLRAFRDEDEITKVLSPAFTNFSIGHCRNDFWGIEERVWIVECKRRST